MTSPCKDQQQRDEVSYIITTAHALRGFQESAILLLLLFDVTCYTFKVAPQTDTFLKAAIITELFRDAYKLAQ